MILDNLFASQTLHILCRIAEQRRQDGSRRKSKEYAQSGCNSFSSRKAPKHRKDVSKDRHHRSAGLDNLAQAQPADGENGEEPFENIAYEGKNAGLFSSRACDVGGSNIPAPGLTHGNTLPLCDEDAGWNRATQVSGDTGNDQNAKV